MLRVNEAMTGGTAVVSVSPESPLKEVANLLLEHRISGVPVVDAEGRVVGVASEADIVSFEAGDDGERGLLARAFAPRDPASVPGTAGEAMTSPAVTIRPDRTVVQAARLIVERDVSRLPVVDDDGKLLGILTRADIVRAFARSDEEIARDVREGVVQRLLGLDTDAIEVAVEDGEVRISGEVATEASARLVEYFASRVPGVVTVHSNLRPREQGE